MLYIRQTALVAAAILVSACASLSEAQGAKLNAANPADALTLARKVQCSTVDNEPAIFWWEGETFSRRQGEKDIHLFDVEGYNIRACAAITNEAGVKGYQLVSREILLYKDKDTGEVLKTWNNPWTGETLEVLHVANDPVNFKSYEVGRDGKPASWGGVVSGPAWWMRSTFPLWYPNPLAGEYQKEIGGTYHATELFNFFGDSSELLDPKVTSAKATVAWTRIADWLPWMMMNGREGVMYIHTSGRKIASYDEVSETMKAEIAAHYPEYASPPPAGDARPNMTSWIYYQGIRNGDIQNPER
ncbi:DUF1838 domain-containing protein [Hyphomonas sp. WL0036]|uniref:DUF1838 family protein n=1 Tax=Hyphomonas sediminis TaxID=2866160 RepID=UPI001C81852C|nr:DUF1838 family protein [Hyphomonas sediminis]MBY9066919.1 DUF1838 domain-containing protein [Hyphomonas sediminis]